MPNIKSAKKRVKVNAKKAAANKAANSAEKFSSGNFAERVEKIYEQQIRKYRYENAA